MITADESLFLIISQARPLSVAHVVESLVIAYPQFKNHSGSHRPDYHHYGTGGLIRHTCEVILIGLNAAKTIRENVDETEYFLSALFHDTGKMFDYALLPDPEIPCLTKWQSTPHKRLIYHIPRSVIIWHDIIAKFPELAAKYEDRVIHNILAHHGSREYGSPVAPKTREAWLLHLADSISARMDDADKMDVVDKKE
jgi:3'-5' exoribonuclease